MNLGLDGARVLITAGANGIGLEIAKYFVKEGALVDVCDIDGKAISNLPDGISGSICDVSNPQSVDDYIDAAIRRLDGVDVLINNAGIAGPTQLLEDMDFLEWKKTLDVNLNGIFHVTRRCIPHLAKSANASIILMSSLAGRAGFPNRSPYSTSKWGVVGMTKTLAMELGSRGIRVNCIQPGAVSNPRFQAVMEARAKTTGRSVDTEIELALSSQSLKKLVEMEEIAALAVFLSSRQAGSISGQAIAIDCDAQFTTNPPNIG